MTPSPPLIPNATIERRISLPVTSPLAAKCQVKRRISLLPASANTSKAVWWSKQSLKTATQLAGSTGESTIANTAIPESP
jgi:hypothetical protein